MAQSFIKLPPDGAGKALHTQELFDGVDNVHNQIFSLGDPQDLDRVQNVDEYGAAYTRGAEGSTIFDAFGKTKVSQEVKLGEYMPTYDTIPSLIDTQIIGTASETHQPNEGSIRLITDINIGDSIKKTTHKYHKYFPGISQYCIFTVAVGDIGKTGVTRRWGYYNDDNGLFFEMDGENFSVVVRSSTSGSVIENRIQQVDFNGDKGDGTGISGVLVDPSKANIYWIDFQWLGAGAVRFGIFSPNGTRLTLNTIQNANSNTAPYMGTGSLPLRWEQFNTIAQGASSEIKIMNATVTAENGNIDFLGKNHSTIDLLSIIPPITITDTWTPIITIRAAQLYKGLTNRNAIIPHNISISTEGRIQLVILEYIITDGTETWAPVLDSSVEVSKDFVIVDPGEAIFSIVIDPSQTNIDITNVFSYIYEYIKLDADGISAHTYTIAARTLVPASTTTAIAEYSWSELII